MATFREHHDLARVKNLQFQLRLDLYSDPPTPQDLQKICKKRVRLGKSIAAILEPSTFALMNRLNPDRIVAFSDVILDYVPFRETILGMEFPVSRYPAEVPAYSQVNGAAAASVYTRDSGYEQKKAAILLSPTSTDAVTNWALEIATSIQSTLEFAFGCSVSRPAENQNTISSVLDSIESIPLVFFIGHAMASANWAGLDLGKLKISLDALSKRDWSDSFIFLVGCETAAIDAFAGDIGSMLIGRGARCVVGTLTKIRVDVAKIFFEEFFVMLLNGSPADYAFCLSRRKTVIYEAMRHGRNEDEAVALTEKVFGDVYEDMSTIVRKTGMSWSKIMKNSPYALSLALLGGVGERLA